MVNVQSISAEENKSLGSNTFRGKLVPRLPLISVNRLRPLACCQWASVDTVINILSTGGDAPAPIHVRCVQNPTESLSTFVTV